VDDTIGDSDHEEHKSSSSSTVVRANLKITRVLGRVLQRIEGL
jgi:hypothetical protein